MYTTFICLLNVRFIKIIILQYDVQAKMYGVFVLIQLILLGGWSDTLIKRASFFRDQRNVTFLTIKFIFINSG